jgi:mRNA interferase MazF
MEYRRGDIYYADLLGSGKSVQCGYRPVIIVQNDIGNKYAPTVTVVPLTSKLNKGKDMPTHVPIFPDQSNGLERPSVALGEQITTISKTDLKTKTGSLDTKIMLRVFKAVIAQVGQM